MTGQENEALAGKGTGKQKSGERGREGRERAENKSGERRDKGDSEAENLCFLLIQCQSDGGGPLGTPITSTNRELELWRPRVKMVHSRMQELEAAADLS